MLSINSLHHGGGCVRRGLSSLLNLYRRCCWLFFNQRKSSDFLRGDCLRLLVLLRGRRFRLGGSCSFGLGWLRCFVFALFVGDGDNSILVFQLLVGSCLLGLCFDAGGPFKGFLLWPGGLWF